MREENTGNTLLGLLRHGQTEWNEQKRIQGHGDSPLSNSGKNTLRLLCRPLSAFGWQRIFASDLGRVRETVDIINHQMQLPVVYDRRLREQHWGEWEGKTLSWIREHHPTELDRRIQWGWEFKAPGGETRGVVRDRVMAALQEYVGLYRGEKILLVCHQGVQKAVLYHLANRDFLPEERPLLENDRLQIIRYDGHQFRPDRLNVNLLDTP